MITYADTYAAAALIMPGPNFALLVLHYLRDNPYQKSLRQHASFWGKVARDPDRLRDVRRKAALKARALLEAAKYLDRKRPTAPRLP